MLLSLGAFMVAIGAILFKMSGNIIEQIIGALCTCVGTFLIYIVGKADGRNAEIESQMRADGIPIETGKPHQPVRVRLPRVTRIFCRRQAPPPKDRLSF
ncbi:MAG: hypothetical protein AAB511_03245 [Patescibacteria group bacterium]